MFGNVIFVCIIINISKNLKFLTGVRFNEWALDCYVVNVFVQT